MALSLDEDRIRGVVAHLAHLRATYGEPFSSPALIEPNGAYFPDTFSLEPQSIAQLLRRMLAYAPLSDALSIELRFIAAEDESGSCGTGGCSTPGAKDVARGSALETDEGYAAMVHVSDVGESAILTTTLARTLGRIVLFEAEESVDPRNEGALAELTALASGFGLLLLNGACVYKKGCGGMRRHQATFLDIEEIALGLALFVRATGTRPSVVQKHVEVTQREVFDAALEWVDEQPALVARLRDQPEMLADGIFVLEEKKGILSRIFGRKDAMPPFEALIKKSG